MHDFTECFNTEPEKKKNKSICHCQVFPNAVILVMQSVTDFFLNLDYLSGIFTSEKPVPKMTTLPHSFTPLLI